MGSGFAFPLAAEREVPTTSASRKRNGNISRKMAVSSSRRRLFRGEFLLNDRFSCGPFVLARPHQRRSSHDHTSPLPRRPAAAPARPRRPAALRRTSRRSRGQGAARPRQGAPAEYECRSTETPITIDGKLDEAAWKDAQVIDHFYLPWLPQPRLSRTATKARLLWDREYLYFSAEMEDTDLYADVTEHDGMTWDNDVFELFFKPSTEKAGYYEFQVNAAGTVMDMFLPRRNAGGYNRFKADGDFHVEAKVRLDGTLNDWRDKDRGWTVEGRIPCDFLRTGGRPAVDERWKFALCRYDYSVDFEGPELSTAPLKAANFQNSRTTIRSASLDPSNRGP